MSHGAFSSDVSMSLPAENRRCPDQPRSTGAATISGAILALQQSCGNAAIRRLIGQNSEIPLVQRQVRKTSENPPHYYSTHDPARTLFATHAEAVAKDKECLARALAGRRQSDRDAAPAPMDEDFVYEKLEGGKGGGKPTKSPHVEYPQYPASLLSAAAATQIMGYSRAAMGPQVTSDMIDTASHKPAHMQNKWESGMVASPTQKLAANNTSRNHKLADSSVAALCHQMWAQMKSSPRTPKQEQALTAFTLAMTGNDKPRAKTAYDLITGAVTQSDAHSISALLNSGIELMSMDMANLRFGDATVNGLILFAFDPSLNSDGTRTPLTEGIWHAVRGLATAGLVPQPMADATLQQAKEKATGNPMSSTPY